MSGPCLLLAAAAAQLAPCGQAASWRTVATESDRGRLRDWRTTWTAALDQARASGRAAPADPLFDPDAGLEQPTPPAGAYRCRYVKLGGPVAYAERDWGRCSVGEGRFARLDGPQRPTGRLFADGPTRAVFLGTLLLGDETRAIRYGRDDARDLIGAVERIGAARWRVVVPQPPFESTLDLIELVPAG